MHLSCQKAFLVLLVSTIGCRDAVAPLALPAEFRLENINGRPLPTSLSISGPAPIILEASLTLDKAGKAMMVEHRRNPDGTEATFSQTFDYRLKGNDIEIGCFENLPIDCAGHFTGMIAGDTLNLLVVAISIDGGITYNYRIAPILD